MKYFIRDYAKYLGLDGEKLVDEFNEFLFDFTSKIPIDQIEKVKKNRTNKKEISSPYTQTKNQPSKGKIILAVVAGVVVLAIISYFVASSIVKSEFQDENITYVIRR